LYETFYIKERFSITHMSERTIAPVSDFWIYNTMLIENECEEYGTGFLVGRLLLSHYMLM
jgi:hypothetical protein